jgi:hypothetical protein
MQIIVSKTRTARKLKESQGKGIVIWNGWKEDMRFLGSLQAEGDATSGTD